MVDAFKGEYNMRERPKVPFATPDTRTPRAAVPVKGIRVSVSPVVSAMRIHGWARTLGMGGLFLETDKPLPADTEVRIEMHVRVEQMPYHLRLLGWVVYWDGGGIGVQFDTASRDRYPDFEEIVSHYLQRQPSDLGPSDTGALVKRAGKTTKQTG